MEITTPIIVNFNRKQTHSPYSLGIQSIRSYCLSMGNEVKLLSCADNPAENVRQILTYNPQVIGFSVNSSSEKIARETIHLLKERTSSPLVVGGPSITYALEDSPILSCNADLFVRGEGEVPFNEMLSGSLEQIISGKITREGVFRKGQFRPGYSIVDLSTLPSPHPLDLDARHAYWETSRGCVFSCIYCAHPGGNNFFRTIPLQRLRDEVNIFKKMPNLEAIYITDPVLGGPKKNTKEVLRLLSELKGKFITASLRPEYLDNEIIQLLKQAKIGWLDIGVQTIHPHLKYFRSNDLRSLQNLSKLREENINYNLDLIFGIPGDSPQGFMGSLKEAVESFKPSSLKLFRLKVYEGTDLHALAIKNGWRFNPENREVEETNGFSEEDMRFLTTLSQNVSKLYSFLESNNWFGKEKIFRKMDTFLRFNEYISGTERKTDKKDDQKIMEEWLHESTN